MEVLTHVTLPGITTRERLPVLAGPTDMPLLTPTTFEVVCLVCFLILIGFALAALACCLKKRTTRKPVELVPTHTVLVREESSGRIKSFLIHEEAPSVD